MCSKFATRLNECRKKKNLTQQQLADLVQTNSHINLSRVSVARYESGVREPEISILLALADALDVPPSFLLGTSDFSSNDIGNEFLKKFIKNVQQHINQNGTSSYINNLLDRLNRLMQNTGTLLYSKDFIELFSLLCEALFLNTMYPVADNLDILTNHLNKMIEDSNTAKQRDLINTSFSKFNVSYSDNLSNETNENTASVALGKALLDVLTDFYTKHPNDPVPDNLKPIVNQILSKHNPS